MKIAEIFWHDSMIHQVIEDADKKTLSFIVDYPVDWENQKWEKRSILFTEVLNYEVHEGPLQQSPTILEANVIGEADDRKTIKIETNAGFRLLSFKHVDVIQAPNT
jgi:hypothetical protein